ncbi:hypothetical protein G3R49_06800 [Shewanella sp. WXL01]|uniref:DUF6997 domain-containing protein n=1 Tax=Shewanella sp. WXL01 TaxID=2709721 RepID=UPI00143861B0|nr:hypothetical protein [Shewanella sp. WXL01]NKF50281.1 hypothetical protein [Shewanella sp. WXL01]
MFDQAIKEIEGSGDIIGTPRSFQDYVAETKLGNKRTAQYISINSISDLTSELKNSGYMVFRLGSPKGSRNTEFALAKAVESWADYFFIDEDIFSNSELEVFLPSASIRSLFAFQLLPTLTETSIVNLAMASGLLTEALGIEQDNNQSIPATGQSVFTFDFQPTSHSNEVLTHNQGQVEIDALFVGKRKGKECLFVIEAKSGKEFDSLAKHKLLYPMLALQNNIPAYMEVIPVYLRTIRKEGYIEFNIAECSIPRRNGVFGALNELKTEKISRFSLHGY